MHSEDNQWSSLRSVVTDPNYDQTTSLVYRPNSGLLAQPSTPLQSQKSSSLLLPDRPRRVLLSDRSSDSFMTVRSGTFNESFIPSHRDTIRENVTIAPDHSQADSTSVFNMMDSSSTNNARRNSEHSPAVDQENSYRPPPAATAINPDDVQARLLKLQTAKSYDIVQRHGQRIYGGPPPDWEGELPGKGTEVYRYRIPRDCFEDELVPVFSIIGPIFELRLMIEFSGTNRTYCYVRYTKKEHATKAVRSVYRPTSVSLT